MERFIEEISNFFDAEPAEVMDRIRALPKPEDLTDLQAWMDCLLKENAELRARVDEGDALRADNKELKDRMKEAKKEVKVARTEQDKSKEIAQKVCKFLGSPGDVLNKARLFDHGLKQPAIDSGVKMIRCMIDYNQKMEKTLKELQGLLKPTGDQPEQAGTPGAGPNTIPAPTASFVTPPAIRPNPLLQEPIPILNTDEMASLRDWAEGGPEALATQQPEPERIRSPSQPPDRSVKSSSAERKSGRNEGRTKKRASLAARKKRENRPSPSVQMRRNMKVPTLLQIRADRKLLPTKSTGRLPGRRPRRSPRGQNGRQRSRRSRAVVVVRPIKGEKGRSA